MTGTPQAPHARWSRSIALVALVLVAGCDDSARSPAGRQGTRLGIAKVSTELFALDAESKALKLDVSLDAMVRERVEASKGLELVDPEHVAGGARLRVSARLLPDGFTGELHALISTKITNTGSIPLTSNVDATREKLADGRAFDEAAYVEHLKKAVADALTALDEQAVVLNSGNAGLIKALEHEETDVRMAAIRALGERRAQDAVEPLCELLRREKAEAGQAAVGSLAMIGSEKAVPCLIQWAGSDDRRLALVIDPMATIGGREAREFLEMIASGHEVEGIKRTAEEGLRRLEAGEKAKRQRAP
jgi:hypothetical protein